MKIHHKNLLNVKIGNYIMMINDHIYFNKIIIKGTIGNVSDILCKKNKIIVDFPNNPNTQINIYDYKNNYYLIKKI